jgi:hypothetical protein
VRHPAHGTEEVLDVADPILEEYPTLSAELDRSLSARPSSTYCDSTSTPTTTAA